jgi:cytochrome d ubiquinol oxidase subunit II
VSERIWDKWLSLPNFVLLAPIPPVTAALFVALGVVLPHLPTRSDRFCWLPFAGAVGIFMLGFHGLAYSFFPYIVPDRLTVWQAAAAPESLMIIFVGALVVLPIIAAHSAFAYRIFWGKATDLRYYRGSPDGKNSTCCRLLGRRHDWPHLQSNSSSLSGLPCPRLW